MIERCLRKKREERFGDGGAKLIWGEACAVTEAAKANPRQIWLAPHTLPTFRELVTTCRAAHRAANGLGACSPNTASYCNARARVVTGVMRSIDGRR